jgi:flagellar protein FliO/FliZ
MILSLTFGTGSYAQFVTLLVVFVLVLALTAFTTKWISGYQKRQNAGSNIEVIETGRIANGKYVQIVRVGEKYLVIAVCKDTVTMLGEIQKEDLKANGTAQGIRFKDILARTAQKEEPEENRTHEE